MVCFFDMDSDFSVLPRSAFRGYHKMNNCILYRYIERSFYVQNMPVPFQRVLFQSPSPANLVPLQKV